MSVVITDNYVLIDADDQRTVLGTLRWDAVLYPAEVQMAAGHLYGALVRAGLHFPGENTEDEG